MKSKISKEEMKVFSKVVSIEEKFYATQLAFYNKLSELSNKYYRDQDLLQKRKQTLTDANERRRAKLMREEKFAYYRLMKKMEEYQGKK